MFKKAINKKRGFTLVELIVVVIILSILSTIGFVSYTGYLEGVRDTNRISQIVAIHDGLEMYRTKKTLPMPDNYINVESNGKIIAYQGFVGKKVLENIEYSNQGKDPKDSDYFSYYLTKDKKSFQLLSFLEQQPEFLLYKNNTFATDYSNRYVYVSGDKLGILTDEFNTPVQKVDKYKNAGKIIISSNTGTLISHFRENGSLKAPGTQLTIIEDLATNGGKPNNCLMWLFMNPELLGGDGIYQLTDSDGKSVQGYCDWVDTTAIPSDGGNNYNVVSSGAISNGDFSGGTDIPTESGSIDINNIISIPSDELPEEIDSGYVLEQEGNDSDYKINIDIDQEDNLASLEAGDVIQLCGWVKDLDDDGYVFNNIIDYVDGKRSYNGKLIKIFQKEKKGKIWSYQCVEHVLIGTPSDFLWRVGYNAEANNKKLKK